MSVTTEICSFSQSEQKNDKEFDWDSDEEIPEEKPLAATRNKAESDAKPVSEVRNPNVQFSDWGKPSLLLTMSRRVEPFGNHRCRHCHCRRQTPCTPPPTPPPTQLERGSMCGPDAAKSPCSCRASFFFQKEQLCLA